MNLVTCTTAGCDGAEHFGDTVPADWMYVLPLPVQKGRTIRPHVGTCPACLAAAKRVKDIEAIRTVLRFVSYPCTCFDHEGNRNA